MTNMEILDLEDKGMEERLVSEALSLLWAQFKHLEDLEASWQKC
jgi:hypothetical protein